MTVLEADVHAFNIGVQRARESYEQSPFAASRQYWMYRISQMLSEKWITREEALEWIAEVKAW